MAVHAYVALARGSSMTVEVHYFGDVGRSTVLTAAVSIAVDTLTKQLVGEGRADDPRDGDTPV